MQKVISKLLPRFLKAYIKEKSRYLKAPRMLYGYQNIGGDFCPKTRLSDTVFLYHPENIRLSDDVFVWHYTILDGTGGIKIGSGTQIGAWVGVFTHSSHIAIRLLGEGYQGIPEYNKPAYVIAQVEIGSYVFVGARTTILPGVTIGDYALIAAHSLVDKNVPPFSIVAGVPARVVGDTRDLDLKELKKLPTYTVEQMLDSRYIEVLKRYESQESK